MSLVVKKCMICGSEVIVLKDNPSIKCCGEVMKLLNANTSDGAVEKHKPEVNVIDNQIEVVVNHVMDDDHYIEWIAIEYDNTLIKKDLKPGIDAKVVFEYKENIIVYSYCNKHGLWMSEVK